MRTKLIIAVMLNILLMFGVANATEQHAAKGVVNSLDESARLISITHEPVKTMGMPAMTMDFLLADSVELGSIKVGEAVNFTVIIDSKGRFVITKFGQIKEP